MRNRIRGSRAENIEAAIKAYEAALTVCTREDFPQDWAMTQNNLANAYNNRIRGDRADNIEQAIQALRCGPEGLHPEGLPGKTGPRPRTTWPPPTATASGATGRRTSSRPSSTTIGLEGLHPEGLPGRLGHDPEQPGQRLHEPHPGRPGGEHRAGHPALRGGSEGPHPEDFPPTGP